MEEEVGLVEEQDRVHNREVKEIRGGSSEEEITGIVGMVEAKDDLGEAKGGIAELFEEKIEKKTSERLSADVTKENCQNKNISRKRSRFKEVGECSDKGTEEESKKENTEEMPEEKRKERKRKRLEYEEVAENAKKESDDDGMEEKKEDKSEKKLEDSHKFKMRLEEESRELELKLLKNPDYRPEPSVFSQDNFSDLDHLLEEDEDSDDCPDFQTTAEAVFESEFY